MIIRPFAIADIVPAAALLRREALDAILHESTPEGARDFLERHGAEGLRANLEAGFVYHAAVMDQEADGELAGFIGMRERSHVYHLFVGQRWQRRGIARALWEAGRDAALGPDHAGVFTVNASNYGLAFYESLGFERSGPMHVGAVRHNPMRLVLASAAGVAPSVGFVAAP